MALPANVSTVTIQGTYVDLQGAPIRGSVIFTPQVNELDASENVTLIRSAVTAVLDANGSFSVTLPVSDDTDLNPVGFAYQVQESFSGGRTFYILIPSGSGATINIADLAAAMTAADSGAYVTSAQYISLNTRYTTANNTFTVISGARVNSVAAQTAATQAASSAGTVNATPSPFLLMGL